MAITDLTGYTLVWNEIVDRTGHDGEKYYLNFISDNKNFTAFNFDGSGEQTLYYYTVVPFNAETVGYEESGSLHSFIDEKWRTIQITGGADVTDPTLISWLEDNGTLTPSSSPSTADKLQDLIDIKQDIKEAIENKGVDLTGVDFGGYAEKIDEIPLPKEEQEITVDGFIFSSGDVVVTPSTGKVMTKVTVVKDNNLVPENIVKDVNIFGVVGTVETGGAPQGETWVINETPTLTSLQLHINFVSNSIEYDIILLEEGSDGPFFSDDAITYGISTIYNNNGWANEAYRTITFETAPTGNLLTWLEANAVKTGDVVELTQAQYDALPVYDNNTYYLIVEE